MIGTRIGTRIGPHIGVAIGLSADAIGGSDPMAGVSRDTLSGIYCPATAGEWATTLAAAGIASGNPSDLWLAQEAAGNLADSIGAAALVAAGAVGYQAAITGWTRKGVTTTEAAADMFSAAGGVGPNQGTQSVLWLAYVQITAYAGARQIMSAGGTLTARENCARVAVATHVTTCKSNGALQSGISDPGTTLVRPWALRVNRTATSILVATDQEKVAGVYNAASDDGVKGFGGDAIGPISAAAMKIAYGCAFAGAAAELTDAQLKTLLQTLGWSPAWS